MVDNNSIKGNSNLGDNGGIRLDILNDELQNSAIDSSDNAISKINSINDGLDLRNLGSDLLRSGNKKSYGKYNGILVILIILFGVAAWMFFKYDQFIVDYSNGIETTDNKIYSSYENAKQKFYKILGKEYETSYSPIDLSSDRGHNNLRSLIQSDKSYIYKKETLKLSAKNLFDSIIRSANNLDATKKHVSTYGFFSDKLSNIISEDEPIIAIQDSMAAIESIKFSSAISVFSKLGTFIETLSKEVGMDKTGIVNTMNQITKRGEKDINLYIKNCYLNGSEIDYNCNNIGDFSKYYELTQDSEFDVSFFKHLMQSINYKLEQTEIPSFSIKFKSFDPKSKDLSFDVEINTFKEDEIEFAMNGILSPHSFILNSLLNNLKLSRAVVSEFIEFRSITVNQRKITFGSTEFLVNTSENSFTVPIKKENQVEIDDFVY